MLLSDKLNLVTIQLGENVSDTSRFEADLEELISYVQQRAPKAQIIIIGDFWDKERNNMRKEAAQNKSVTLLIYPQLLVINHISRRKGRLAS